MNIEAMKPHCYMDEYGYVEGEMKRYMEEQGGWFPVYTTPPQREWQSLTDDEIKEIIGSYAGPIKGYTRELFDKIEAKLREKNSG